MCKNLAYFLTFNQNRSMQLGFVRLYPTQLNVETRWSTVSQARQLPSDWEKAFGKGQCVKTLTMFPVLLIIIFSFLARSVAGRGFIWSAKGTVDKPNVTSIVQRDFECAAICSRTRVCSYFSVTAQNESPTNGTLSDNFTCQVAFRYTSWTPHNGSDLYIGKLDFPSTCSQTLYDL